MSAFAACVSFWGIENITEIPPIAETRVCWARELSGDRMVPSQPTLDEGSQEGLAFARAPTLNLPLNGCL